MFYISKTLCFGFPNLVTTQKCYYATHKAHDPLRILFCGSEDFSIASLKALHREHLRQPKNIASLDVVCRPGKPTGRGLKAIREVPIANVARELQLPLHQIDTFTKWQPPKPEGRDVNLVVAVSFGLLVPPRILEGCKYGGLNVHPSILPDLRGPAPLHHTLLAGRERTGITVQTLHPKRFDQGVIIAQTPLPGFKHHCETLPELVQRTASEGSKMLIKCIKNRDFVPPLEPKGHLSADRDLETLHKAPKIIPQDRHIDWATMTADEIMRRHRVIGPLWNDVGAIAGRRSSPKRIIWSSGFVESNQTFTGVNVIGEPFVWKHDRPGQAVYVRTCDGKILEVDKIKFDGRQESDPVMSSSRASLFPGSILGIVDALALYRLLNARLF